MARFGKPRQALHPSPALCMAFLALSIVVPAMADPSIVVQPPRPGKDLTVSVTDYGADPLGKRSSWKAFVDAIEACRKLGASRLVFPKGQYIFTGQDVTRPGAHMILDGLNDLTIDGQGSELIFHHIRHVMLLTNCQRVVVRNFTVDWDSPSPAPRMTPADSSIGESSPEAEACPKNLCPSSNHRLSLNGPLK